MHKEIYDFAVAHHLEPVHNRKSSRIAAYIVLDADGTYHGIDVLDKDAVVNKSIPDLGTYSRTPKQANPIVEKAEYIFCKDAKKHASYVSGIECGCDTCTSLSALWSFLSEFENDDFYSKIISDFEASGLKMESVISYRIDGVCIEDMDDWHEWFADYVNSFANKKKSADTIISSISGKLQEGCPAAGGPALEDAKNKAAFGLGRAAYIASAKYASYESYGFKGAENFQIGLDDANCIKAGFEMLLKDENYHDSNFSCVFFYDKEVENLIKESLNAEILDEDSIEELCDDIMDHMSLLHDILKAAQTGVQPRLVDDSASYYILGINAKSQGRYYLSNEKHGKYNDLIQNLYKWYTDTCIFTGNKTVSVVKFYNILLNCVSTTDFSKRNEMVSKEFSFVRSMLLNAIYDNKQIPEILYHRALYRISIDASSVEDNRNFIKVVYAQILKCYLIRKGYQIMPEVMNDFNIAYACGKLFSVYEQMQYKYNHSSGRQNELNKTLSAAYFTAAMKRPANTFAQLADLGNVYINGIDAGSSAYFTNLLGHVSSEIGTVFPNTFDMDERGSFVLGYYQQRAAFMQSAKEHSKVEKEKENQL